MDDVTKLHGEKNPFNGKDRPVDFEVALCEKLIDMVSDFTLQMSFKKLPLVKFWCNIKKNTCDYLKGYYNYSCTQLPICVIVNILHRLQ